MSDLQNGVEVGTGAITGTLKAVTGYTGFSGDTDLQSGHYLVIHAECEDADSITVEIVGGTSGPVTLDEDGIFIGRIASTTQSIKVTAKAEDYDDVVKTFTLSGLTLA